MLPVLSREAHAIISRSWSSFPSYLAKELEMKTASTTVLQVMGKMTRPLLWKPSVNLWDIHIVYRDTNKNNTLLPTLCSVYKFTFLDDGWYQIQLQTQCFPHCPLILGNGRWYWGMKGDTGGRKVISGNGRWYLGMALRSENERWCKENERWYKENKRRHTVTYPTT